MKLVADRLVDPDHNICCLGQGNRDGGGEKEEIVKQNSKSFSGPLQLIYNVCSDNFEIHISL